MWIDGRRAFRPDSKYYRDTRRARLSGSGAARRGSIIGAVIAIVVVAIVATAYVLMKH